MNGVYRRRDTFTEVVCKRERESCNPNYAIVEVGGVKRGCGGAAVERKRSDCICGGR
ncbi:hypothetical protein Hanom_Chr07g00628271 [Helianthus anomalus]